MVSAVRRSIGDVAKAFNTSNALDNCRCLATSPKGRLLRVPAKEFPRGIIVLSTKNLVLIIYGREVGGVDDRDYYVLTNRNDGNAG